MTSTDQALEIAAIVIASVIIVVLILFLLYVYWYLPRKNSHATTKAFVPEPETEYETLRKKKRAAQKAMSSYFDEDPDANNVDAYMDSMNSDEIDDSD